MLALAAVAFVIGAIVGAQAGGSATDSLGAEFRHRVDARRLRDHVRGPGRRLETGHLATAFASAYQAALRTATATHLAVTGKAADASGGARRRFR